MAIYDEKQIEIAVMAALEGMGLLKGGDVGSTVSSKPLKSSAGVFETMGDAIENAATAQKKFVSHVSFKERESVLSMIRSDCLINAEAFAKMAVEETGLGRWEDKFLKNTLTIKKTPGTEALTTYALSGDNGLMIEEFTPYGLIGSITPVTNPAATIINNSISMIAAGNGVVFNVHPSAKKTYAMAMGVINGAIERACGIQNLITMVENPTMKTVEELLSSNKVRMLVGTGGMGLVISLLKSGKKCIGAGAGNPPVIVDETADIERAAKEIFRGASFDNNVLCIAEKEVFAVKEIADELIYNMVKAGAYLLSSEEVRKITELVFYKDDNGWHSNKNWVGKNAGLMLKNIGVDVKDDVRLLIFEADYDNPFVHVEQLMPVLPIVRCENVDEGIEMAVSAEAGRRHTASIYSKNIDNMTRFARLVDTTIFVKNAATLAGMGDGGEGSCTMTIAGPTGEGLTDARAFSRKRRCSVCDGGFRIY